MNEIMKYFAKTELQKWLSIVSITTATPAFKKNKIDTYELN